MSTRRKSGNSSQKLAKEQNIQRVCAFCDWNFDDEEDDERHVELHKIDGKGKRAMCQSCYQIIEKDNVTSHLEEMHKISINQTKVEVNNTLIEYRIENSNFWAVNPDSKQLLVQFARRIHKNWLKLKTARSLAVFRIGAKKLIFRCAICEEGEVKNYEFNETIGMRAFALSHWEQCHRDVILKHLQGFLQSEWSQLSYECFDFDIRALMRTARKRCNMESRSCRTFYTVNLHSFGKNGKRMEAEMKRRSGMEGDTRFCLVCCCLVEDSSRKLQSHFRNTGHDNLKSTSTSTIFTEIVSNSRESSPIVKRQKTEQNNGCFEFPASLFRYSISFKNSKRDDFCWKCSICSQHTVSFATWHVLRMFALRHIDEHHSNLFTDEFLDFEWRAIRQELHAGFDLRAFSPLQYTIRGEGTFNQTDPNDYTLPQQAFFLPKQFHEDTVICGFCFRSLHLEEFVQHIVLHGFTQSESTCRLKTAERSDKRAKNLMGEYTDELLDDEPDRILSVEGKRLRDKTLADSKAICTPAKSEDGYTPRCSRQSAHDARNLLAETFRVLQEQARNNREHFSSSSSSDENSDDEKFEESVMSKAELEKKTLKRKRIESRRFDELKPSEIRAWILEEAVKRGIQWVEPESSDEEGEEVLEESNDGKKWKDMKPQEIRDIIKKAALEQNLKLEPSSSSSSSTDNEEN